MKHSANLQLALESIRQHTFYSKLSLGNNLYWGTGQGDIDVFEDDDCDDARMAMTHSEKRKSVGANDGHGGTQTTITQSRGGGVAAKSDRADTLPTIIPREVLAAHLAVSTMEDQPGVTLLETLQAVAISTPTKLVSTSTSVSTTHFKDPTYQTFTLYPILPDELKMKIMKFSLPAPKVIQWDEVLQLTEYDLVTRIANTFPIALHVCRMWRTEALNLYAILQSASDRNQQIYMDVQRDSLYVATHARDFPWLFGYGRYGSRHSFCFSHHYIRHLIVHESKIQQVFAHYGTTMSTIDMFRQHFEGTLPRGHLPSLLLYLGGLETVTIHTDTGPQVQFCKPKEKISRLRRNFLLLSEDGCSRWGGKQA